MMNNFNNGANDNNNNKFGGEIIMTNNTLRTFEAFVSTVKSAMEILYSEGYVVDIQKVTKNNGLELTALVIRTEGVNIAPTIYLNGFYSQYQDGRTMADIVKEIRQVYESNKISHDFNLDMVSVFDEVKNKICFKLVNAKKNEELLTRIPYVPFHDLAVVFFIEVGQHKDGNATIQVSNALMALWGNPSVDEVYSLAKANTQRLFKGQVRNMMDVLDGMMPELADNDMDDVFCMDLLEDSFMPMFVATNTMKINGASVILYDGLLAEFSRRIGADCFILPSSTHEVILLPANMGADADELIEMVKVVNATEVSPDEVLSDRVYYYHADLDVVEMM